MSRNQEERLARRVLTRLPVGAPPAAAARLSSIAARWQSVPAGLGIPPAIPAVRPRPQAAGAPGRGTPRTRSRERTAFTRSPRRYPLGRLLPFGEVFRLAAEGSGDFLQ
jgi:hypothetical protein